MKKAIALLVVAVSIISFTSSVSFAAVSSKFLGAAYTTIEGKVESLNPSHHLFVIRDKDDGESYQFTTSDSNFSSLKQGENIQVTVGQFTNVVSSLVRS